LTEVLIANGANISTTAYKGRTPYDYARELHQYDIAKLLKKAEYQKKADN